MPPPPADPAPYRGYVVTVLLALDDLANAVLVGRYRDTISARMGRHAALSRTFLGCWPAWARLPWLGRLWLRHCLWTLGPYPYGLPVLPRRRSVAATS